MVHDFLCCIDEQDGTMDDYADMIRRDRRRWDLADTDKDNRLTKLQYTHFLHPEDEDHMREVVIEVSWVEFYVPNSSMTL